MASKCCGVFGGMLAIVGAASLIGGAHSVIHASVGKPIVLTLTDDAPDNPEEPENSIGVATLDLSVPDRVRDLYQDGYLFLDARPLYQYEQGHIEGALWMPSSRVTENGTLFFEIEDEAGGLGEPVVIYCGGGDCDASENLAMLLQQAGFTDLIIFKQGYPAWEASGHETQVGAPLEIEP